MTLLIETSFDLPEKVTIAEGNSEASDNFRNNIFSKRIYFLKGWKGREETTVKSAADFVVVRENVTHVEI